MIDMERALRLIITRSGDAMNDAMGCIQALRVSSPMVGFRFNRTVERALADREARFTDDERAELAALLEIPSGTRDQTLRVRLTTAEADELARLAEAEGVSMSEYVRSRVFPD